MKSIVFILILLVPAFSILMAQPARNAAERAGDRTQVAVGKAQMERDRQELESFRSKALEFESAWESGDKAKMASLKDDLLSDMKREIAQGEAKKRQDVREVAGSKSEVRSERREVRSDRRKVAAPGHHPGERAGLAADRVDRADDRKDLSDDRRDYANQAALLARQKEILSKLENFTFSREAGMVEKGVGNKALIKEFTATMEADIAFTRRELGEDRGEIREDRRETRDDRR